MSERGPAAAPPAGMAVTDHQIAQVLDSLLRETNALTTITAVVEQLQSKLGVNLLHKIDFIRSQTTISTYSTPISCPWVNRLSALGSVNFMFFNSDYLIICKFIDYCTFVEFMLI